jgi:hypothetical protein
MMVFKNNDLVLNPSRLVIVFTKVDDKDDICDIKNMYELVKSKYPGTVRGAALASFASRTVLLDQKSLPNSGKTETPGSL